MPGTISLPQILEACFPGRRPDAVAKIVGGLVRGTPYYACYRVSGDTDRSLDPVVVDRLGRHLSDAGLIKEAGAWPSVGTVTSSHDVLAFSLGAVIALVLIWFLYVLGTRDAAGDARQPTWWMTAGLVITWIVVGIGGLVALVFVALILRYPDAAGLAAVALVLASVVYGALARDIVVAQPLLPWLRLQPTRRSLAAALAVSASLIPSLVAFLVLLAGLGEVPPTGTLVTGLLVVATGVSGLATALVVLRWRGTASAGTQHVGPAWRRALALALLLAGWAGATALAVSVASAYAPYWRPRAPDSDAVSVDSARAERDQGPDIRERRAAELVCRSQWASSGEADGLDVQCSYR